MPIATRRQLRSTGKRAGSAHNLPTRGHPDCPESFGASKRTQRTAGSRTTPIENDVGRETTDRHMSDAKRTATVTLRRFKTDRGHRGDGYRGRTGRFGQGSSPESREVRPIRDAGTCTRPGWKTPFVRGAMSASRTHADGKRPKTSTTIEPARPIVVATRSIPTRRSRPPRLARRARKRTSAGTDATPQRARHDGNDDNYYYTHDNFLLSILRAGSTWYGGSSNQWRTTETEGRLISLTASRLFAKGGGGGWQVSVNGRTGSVLMRDGPSRAVNGRFAGRRRTTGYRKQRRRRRHDGVRWRRTTDS